MGDLPRPAAPRAKRGRLSRAADFERVYRQGRSHSNRYFVLHAFPREVSETGEQSPRLGLSVSRKVGGAVDRNKVKRLLREAFVTEGQRLDSTQDIVVVARPEARDLADREGLDGVRRELAELVGQAAGKPPA